VWNPWSDGVAKIPDLAPDAWSGFVCVEAANTGTETVVLNAGETHTMQVVVSIAAA
jgi:glucose-6-phosphate 1-epimerase